MIPRGQSRRKSKSPLLQTRKVNKHTETLDSHHWRSHKFDETTGQVYNEQTASTVRPEELHWTRQTRVILNPDLSAVVNRPKETFYSRSRGGTIDQLISDHHPHRLRTLRDQVVGRGRGARSLQDIAMENILQQISDITSKSVEHLPVHIIKRIWNTVSIRCDVSFDTWALFSQLLYKEGGISNDVLRYSQAFHEPNLLLLEYTTPLISASFAFLTTLRITTSFPTSALVKLSEIPNLASLEIHSVSAGKGPPSRDSSIHVSDRLMRAWHLAAQNEGAFQVLRILRLWYHESLTHRSLQYLNSFPSLALYDVKGCHFDRRSVLQSLVQGWSLNTEPKLLDFFIEACEARSALLHKSAGNPRPPYSPEEIWLKPKIWRIPRNEVRAFIASRSNEEEQISKCWDVPEALARIGELRSDKDYVRAGVPLPDQALLAEDLIVSIPIASVALGYPPKEANSPEVVQRSKCLAFTRTGTPAGPISKRSSSPTTQTPDLKSSAVRTSNQVNNSREPGMVPKRRKKNLDDLLNSFS